MANANQLRILLKGGGAWDKWRAKHPEEIIDLSFVDLRGVDLRDLDLRGADLRFADLRSVLLSRANLRGVDLRGADLRGVNLRGVNLRSLDLSGTDLRGADLRGANLHSTNLRDLDLSGIDLRDANLRGANLHGANLHGANLLFADLHNALLSNANLDGVNFRGLDLRGLDLSGANLRGANLDDANLDGVDLRGMDLGGANLRGANLRGADLRVTNLSGTHLDRATLTDACLWESHRANWSIHDITCAAAYWDEDGQEQIRYQLGEFEQLYAEPTKLVLRYEEGISAIELATLPALTRQLEVTHPACALRLESVQTAADGATVTLGIEDTGGRNSEEREALQQAIETASQQAIRYLRTALAERTRREELELELAIVHNVYTKALAQSMEHSTKRTASNNGNVPLHGAPLGEGGGETAMGN